METLSQKYKLDREMQNKVSFWLSLLINLPVHIK